MKFFLSYISIHKRIGHLMAAFDDLKLAVDNAVAEMNAAADFIRNHTTLNNDPAVSDMATRLKAASDALHAVDQPL